MDQTLLALRAAGEPTRLRLLIILSQSELTVTEICRLLGQSQPRVSRHLKVLCDAHLLERAPEGAWVFYRLANRGRAAELARLIIASVPGADSTVKRDIERLSSIKAEHAAAAAAYFSRSAADWERLSRLYFANPEVESAMLAAVDDVEIEDYIDLGTGAGRLLKVFADRVKNGTGFDASREMLAIARANLEAQGLGHCSVRQADITNLSIDEGSADLVTIHHVLHYLDDAADVVASAAKLLRDEGVLMVVDFAPHEQEAFREEFAHRRLGFTDKEVRRWLQNAGFAQVSIHHFDASPDTTRDQADDTLNVPPITLWIARRTVTSIKRKNSGRTKKSQHAA